MDNNFEKLILEKLDSMQSDMNGMKEKVNKIDGIEKRLDNMEEKVNKIDNTVKKTALKVETELTPKVQTMLDLYAGLAEKVTISNDLHEEVKILRYEVDIIKQVLSAKQ